MNILITFDYELFFGSKSGTFENCLIIPTNEIIKIADKYNIKLIFFVDAGFFMKLKEYKKKYFKLKHDYEAVCKQIKSLYSNGHDIQLHIHPHWEDSYYDGENWVMDLSRYKLSEFNRNEIDNIIEKYKKTLMDIIEDNVFAYRSGGWCIQPFEKIKNSLKKNKIWLDSTVYKGGYNKSSTHYFNFKKTPNENYWSFEDDPLVFNTNGYFLEVPISQIYLTPFNYWQFALSKKMNKNVNASFGDGIAIKNTKKDILFLLLKGGHSAVSTDGYKSNFLIKALKKYQSIYKENDYFVTIGHPKAVTKLSLQKLDNFFSYCIHNNNNFITYRNIPN